MKLKEIDLIENLKKFWEWIFAIQHWNTMEGWIARFLVWIFVAYGILYVLRHMLELFAKISDSWKSLGLNVTRSREEISILRRRQQFCKVLASDLATLAKAESWNDQSFTDLEAEVEAEGGYYASAADRLLKRKSNGLRRVPSLIEAIETSTEQCLLVTGDPGSGKSVALRHLASQLAEKSTKSKSNSSKIPLYINLKELPEPPLTGPSADFIKDFVLENIRRGDADTAAYVRENWVQYREQGHWFFLFDSFDEIPAILHAPTGSRAIQQHADAIRKFFEGMSSCKGVLASREFKGPESLPWNRFRILPLSPRRQEELIDNSFLLPTQKKIALQHVAAVKPGFLANPLFLTLLCRYVKDENVPPTNDNELLYRHIKSLANREPEYVKKRYGFSPEEIIEYGIHLSRLFAENDSLSLAPTQNDILKTLDEDSPLGKNLNKILSALIDVKIGRCDVKEAVSGDQRFTFAHRRYQEALFVQYLSKNPQYLSPDDLLTNLKWRDYAVTLLQTGSFELVKPLMDDSVRLLEAYAQARKEIKIEPCFSKHDLHYYNWNDEPGTHLLRLLNEGLCRRPELATNELRDGICAYLEAPWRFGDSYDRRMVISLGGLLPDEDLKVKLHWAIAHGTRHHWNSVVETSMFLYNIPDDLAKWLRNYLSNLLLTTRNRSDVAQLEVISGRLPKEVGADWVVERVHRIRRVNLMIQKVFIGMARLAPARFILKVSNNFALPGFILDPSRNIIFNYYYLLSYSLIIGILLILSPITSSIFVNDSKDPTWIKVVITTLSGIVISLFSVKYILLMYLRSVGEELRLRIVIDGLFDFLARVKRRFKFVLILLFSMFAMWLSSVGIVWAALFLMGFQNKVSLWKVFVFGPCVVLFVSALVCMIVLRIRNYFLDRRLSSLHSSLVKQKNFLIYIKTWDEVKRVLYSNIEMALPSCEEARSFMRCCDAVREGVNPFTGTTLFADDVFPEDCDDERIKRSLMYRCVELEESASAPALDP